MIEEEIIFKNQKDLPLSGIVALPDSGQAKSFAVLLHGFVHHKNSSTNKALSVELTKMGVGTLRYDSHGHGESYGDLKELETTKGIEDVKAALDYVRSEHGAEEVALVGSSFGGWIALAAAEKYTDEIDFLVLKEPVCDFKALWDEETDTEKWKEEGIYEYKDWKNNIFEIGYGFYDDILNYDLYSGVLSLSMPVLIVHGAADQVVPASQSQKLAGLLGERCVLRLIEDADHGFSEPAQFNKMIDQIISWFSAQLG